MLSLSKRSDADAIPLAHYYDGNGLYFRLGITDGSRKREFLKPTACYVLYGANPTEESQELDSWSIVITDLFVELLERESDRFDTVEINRHFPPIRVFDEAIENIASTIVELDLTR